MFTQGDLIMNGVNFLKHSLFAATAFLAAATYSANAADVGVSVTVGQPGFYGRIDIGDYPYPQPRLIYRKPIIIHRPAAVIYEPIYMHVPPGHAKNWRRYCGRYNACGEPVYFVHDRWYNEVYVPQYHERHGNHEWHEHDRHRHGHGHRNSHGHGRGHGRD